MNIPRRVLITGGASGIGAATAAALVADGCAVTIVDRSDEIEAVAEALDVTGIRADVSDSAEIDDAVERAADAMGGLDGVFANAGVGNLKALHTYTDDEFDRLVRVNLHGTFFTLRATIPRLLGSGGGAVSRWHR